MSKNVETNAKCTKIENTACDVHMAMKKVLKDMHEGRKERVEVWDVLEGRRTSKAACGRNDSLARAHWSLAGNAMAWDGGGGAGEPMLVSVSHTGGIEIRRIFATEADEPA